MSSDNNSKQQADAFFGEVNVDLAQIPNPRVEKFPEAGPFPWLDRGKGLSHHARESAPLFSRSRRVARNLLSAITGRINAKPDTVTSVQDHLVYLFNLGFDDAHMAWISGFKEDVVALRMVSGTESSTDSVAVAQTNESFAFGGLDRD